MPDEFDQQKIDDHLHLC